MAEKQSKSELAKLPGGVDFDVDNASEEDYAKHIGILRRRKEVADASVQDAATEPVTTVKATPLAPNPTDIRAVKDGETRYFSDITWAAMETKGEHAGWEVAVDKPADLK